LRWTGGQGPISTLVSSSWFGVVGAGVKGLENGPGVSNASAGWRIGLGREAKKRGWLDEEESGPLPRHPFGGGRAIDLQKCITSSGKKNSANERDTDLWGGSEGSSSEAHGGSEVRIDKKRRMWRDFPTFRHWIWSRGLL